MTRAGLEILLVALLGLACGKTSHSVPADDAGGAAVGDAGGNGGASASTGTPTGGSAAGGAGGRGGELSYVDLTGAPIYTQVQRLTNTQWENAVSDILHLPPHSELSATFAAPLSGQTAFDNNEQVLLVDPRHFTDYESAAEAAASIATGSPEALAALDAGDDAPSFVRAFGRRAFRRPLSAEEETKYRSVFALGERLYGAGFANGAALVIRAMLQSPHFLYRTELGPAGEALSAYELASKLSFWLLGTTPSDAMLDAADAGRLSSEEQLVTVARQMLEDPRAVSVMRDFHGQLFHVAYLEGITNSGVAGFGLAVNPELRPASQAFFDLIFTQNFGLRELLSSTKAYVGPGLAPFYGLQTLTGSLELRDVGPTRKGYFMQVPFLMLRSYGDVPNSMQRGFQLESRVLCMQRQPDPSVVTLPPPTEPIPGQTNRQRVNQVTGTCGASCHQFMDPLGFAFENFDGLGRSRDMDNGQAIDTTGSYPLTDGPVQFADGPELMTILADSTQAHTCYSKHVTGYALGRDLVESDRPLLDSLAKVSRSSSLKDLIVALVREPAFRMRKGGLP